MAKLEGVKVIEATGGDITRVEYGGAQYTLVSGIGKVGDLAQCNRKIAYFTKGEFYKVMDISSRECEYIHAVDDEGDRYYMDLEETAKLFRKIEQPSASTPKYNVGDVVVTLEKCGWAKDDQGLMLAGAIGKVKSVYGDILTVKFNKKQPFNCEYAKKSRKKFVVTTSEIRLATEEEAASIAKKKAEIIEFEGDQYRKVERGVQAGDVIVFRENTSICADNGVKYLVVSDRGEARFYDAGSSYNVYAPSYGRTPETVDVYEKVEAEAKPFTKGDVVVITANTNNSRNAVGDIGKIISDADFDGDFKVEVPSKPDFDGANDCWTKKKEMRKATPDEVKAYEKALHKASFSVGDFVKIVKSYDGKSEGDIVKITEVGKFMTDEGICEFEIEDITVKRPGKFAVKAEQIVKATEQEVADASKPKLKVGDFVKFTQVSGFTSKDITLGKAYEIEEGESELGFFDDNDDFRTVPLSCTDCYGIISAEDMAEYKRALASRNEEVKWENIGRKPGEFKKGDIVRVNSGSTGGHPTGTIGELVSGDIFAFTTEFGVLANGETYDHTMTGFELIAPVESTLK